MLVRTATFVCEHGTPGAKVGCEGTPLHASSDPTLWAAKDCPQPTRTIEPTYLRSVGTMVANMIGAPIAAGLLAMDGIRRLK
jgi:hypothetical protein